MELSNGYLRPQPYNLYSDATLRRGGWVNHSGASSSFSVASGFQGNIFLAEFYAAYRAIKDNGERYMHISLHCDNMSLCMVLNSHGVRHPGRHPLLFLIFLDELFAWIHLNHIKLTVSWIPSECNPADGPSRIW
jgi:hypothetical protein